jgi:OOP family OmpA-OmpF porin
LALGPVWASIGRPQTGKISKKLIMKKKIKRAGIALLGAALLVLQGCGTSSVSRSISDDGRAGEVVFPEIDKHAWLKEGTFPNLDNLRRVAPGVSKDQLYDLLGRPHFSEGMGSVREWDYIFNFRTGKGSEYITCQYKVIFDKAYRGQSFHWAPQSCAEQLKEKPSAVAERVAEKPTAIILSRVHLAADALFAFDKSGPSDLLLGGRSELDRLADDLRKAGQIAQIDVVGHTDRLGSDSYNQQLCETRARTVREYLVSKGLPADSIMARGKGARDPVVQCDHASRTALIACLAPNRRVEIAAHMRVFN